MKKSHDTGWTAWTALGTSAVALSVSLTTACDNEGASTPQRTSQSAPTASEADEAQATKAPAQPHAVRSEKRGADPIPTNDDGPPVAQAATNPPKDDPEHKGNAEERPSPDSSGLEVKRLVVTHEVKNREPVESGSLEVEGGPIYAFVELANEAEIDAGIVITFEHESGTKVGHVELEVPAKQRRWRTWGRTRLINEPGQWEAVVRGADGQELGRQGFEVSPKA